MVITSQRDFQTEGIPTHIKSISKHPFVKERAQRGDLRSVTNEPGDLGTGAVSLSTKWTNGRISEKIYVITL